VNVPPNRPPDAVVEEKTDANQALLYRLSGDWNPLHADPAFAKNFGFERPILHGLCTFGFAGRHVVAKCAPGGDPRLFKSIKARFAESVFPGETLVTEMWKESETRVVFTTKVKERGKVVISNAAVEFFAEVPKAAEKSTANPAPAEGGGAQLTRADVSAPPGGAPPANAAAPTSADVFTAIEDHIARNSDLVGRVGKTFVFKLVSPDSAWTVDVKSGKGAVAVGAIANPDVTLELADADFLAMTSGKADAMKLYMAGKLKISGDVMASQKLDFLRTIDPKQAAEAVAKKRGGATATASSPTAASSTPPATSAPTSAETFKKLAERLSQNPGLAKEVGVVLQFDVKSPDKSWVVDMTSAGAVREGTDSKATTVFRIADADLVALCKDPASSRDLYQRGKLRVDGDVRLAHKLGFLKDL
jgi:3-hydroxyacyl-CoA dehydrogenase/3a,7a,12a-trihydroxy-5b-cholest-24-enoyl-CoA hydratase